MPDISIEDYAEPMRSGEIQLPEEIHGSYVKILGRAAFMTFYQNGVRKMITTDRIGLALYRDKINAALANPENNKDGKTIRREAL